jgi:hypothetical protein
MIHYKIKKSDSNEYWTGYSSQFSTNGIAYRSLEDVGTAINAQLSNKRAGIHKWIDTAQVIAFEVITRVVCAYDPVATVELSKLLASMQKDYGRNFVTGFKQLANRNSEYQFKYAAQIPPSEYASFRETMKTLGFSSRHYRKYNDWIFFTDDDLCMRVKLVGTHTKFVNMDAYVDQYTENTRSYPADNSLMDDAVFDDDYQEEDNE